MSVSARKRADTAVMATSTSAPAKPSLLYRLSLLSPRRRKIAEVRTLWTFCRQMSALLDARVDVVTALGEVAASTQATSPEFAAAVRAVRDGVRTGHLLTDSMADHNVFPPLLVQMTEVGERHAWLAEAFAKAADFYGDELDYLRRIPRVGEVESQDQAAASD